MMNYVKLCSLVSIALVLTVLTGCGRMELLEYDNIASYESLDRSAMAPPDMSLQDALDIIKDPSASDSAKAEAISVITAAIGLKTSSIEDPNKTYSIEGMAQAMEEALKGSGLSLSKDTLQNIIISAINETIKQVNTGALDRTKPENAGLFALAEGIQQKTGKSALDITDVGNTNLIDTAGFLVLTTAVNQAVNSVADDAIIAGSESAIQETVDKVNSVIPGFSGDKLASQLIPQPNPLLGGLLTNVVKQQLVKEPEVIQKKDVLTNTTKSDTLVVVDEKITNQVATELTSTLKQMQADGMLQGVSIPDKIDFDGLRGVLNQVSASDRTAIEQQVSTIQDKVVEEVKTDVATGINNIEQSSQTKVEDFVETTAKEMGTTVVVEPIMRPHTQGIVTIE